MRPTGTLPIIKKPSSIMAEAMLIKLSFVFSVMARVCTKSFKYFSYDFVDKYQW